MPKKSKAKNFEVEDVAVAVVQNVDVKELEPIKEEEERNNNEIKVEEERNNNEVKVEEERNNNIPDEKPIEKTEESIVTQKKRTRAKPAIPKQKIR